MRTDSAQTPNLSWQEEFRSSFKQTKELAEFLEVELPKSPYPLFIPQKFAKKIKEAGPNSPLWLQFVPSSKEISEAGLEDPIGDELYSKGHGIIHRYKNRALFSPTEVCPIQCRYCFRKNELHQNKEFLRARLNQAARYLEDHPEIEEVILTGGDPLVLSDEKLREIFEVFSSIPSIKIIRLHSRTPVVLPSRMTPSLIQLFRDFSFSFDLMTLVVHTNHISEWSPEFLMAMEKLRTTRVQLLSQSVLLKGVNNSLEDLKVLFSSLPRYGVVPYYLHHPDPVKGAMHFRISLFEGRQLYAQLKQNISGYMLPHYVIELPEGLGKAHAFSSQDPENKEQWLTKDGQWIKPDFW